MEIKRTHAELVGYENWEKEEVHEKFRVDGVVAEDNNGNLNVRVVKVKRNPQWEQLDWNYIHSVVGLVNRFEYVMCENQCKNNDISIRAILKSRKATDDLNEYMSWYRTTTARERYIRSHYNDDEEDNYERQEQRCLNG